MMTTSRLRWLLSGVSTAAMACVMALPADAQSRYVSGDFHNHTPCSDAEMSVQSLMTSGTVTWGLDWLVQTDHGGNSYRDCAFDDRAASPATALSPAYPETLYHAFDAEGVTFKGDPTTATGRDGVKHTAMWRWQNIKEFEYPLILAASRSIGKTMWEGYEQIVPGHEHAEVTVVNGQIPTRRSSIGNADALAQHEYLFDRADGDLTGPGLPGWSGKISNVGLVGNAAHAKSVSGVSWLQTNYPLSSYYIPAHTERAGPFSTTGNAGYNVEHFRDFNNAGPTVAIGFETQPGHLATGGAGRGGYGTGAVGGGTYGGTGIYGAAIGGLWDAMLGEGRNWFFYASSDFHSRGTFAPNQRESTSDFQPGEYQKQWVAVTGPITPQSVVNALRTGDTFSVQGDLITSDLTYSACQASAGVCTGPALGMGRTVVVTPGSDVLVTLTVTLPAGANNSPYSFPNPILLNAGLGSVPLNKPVLDHIDLITGNITGVVAPGTANYAGLIGTPAASNASTTIAATFGSATWTKVGQKVTVTYAVKNVTGPRYVRARATNMPAGIPNVTDAAGNPLLDANRVKIPCTDAACPPHVIQGTGTPLAGQKAVDNDIRGWSELWVYLNPIFIRTTSDAALLVETNASLARSLGGLSPL